MAVKFFGDNMWDQLKDEMNKDYFKNLIKYVKEEYDLYTIHPDYDKIFNAYRIEPKDIKVVILGQDPYHNFNEAHGYSFSVLSGNVTPSLKNIYKEMESDLGVSINQNGNLEYLVDEGVFLLNTILTVRHNEPLSHKKKGWEIFTDKTIEVLNMENHPIVFILWGNESIKKKELITNPIHLILTSSHPSPLGAHKSFFGSKPFSKTNEFLISHNIKPVKWYKDNHMPTLFDI